MRARRPSDVAVPCLILALLVCPGLAAAETARLPRAALVAGSPLTPTPATLAVLRQQLGAGLSLIDDEAVRRELEGLDRAPTPEQVVQDALRDAMQRMRRLALEEVQRTLEEVEPYVQQLPPTPGARSLLCTWAIRRAHVALLLGDQAAATASVQRGLSAAPDFKLDQAQEPPPLVELFERVRRDIQAAPRTMIRVTTVPPGAMVVMGETPLGRAPLLADVPADTAVMLWALQDGYGPRNVTARAARADGGRPLSVVIQIEVVPAAEQLRPLVDALRGPPQTREYAARALLRALKVDTVVLAELGMGRPRLWLYGQPPRWPAVSPVPSALDLVVMQTPPEGKKRAVPPWLWAIIGAAGGAAITAGAIYGSMR